MGVFKGDKRWFGPLPEEGVGPVAFRFSLNPKP